VEDKIDRVRVSVFRPPREKAFKLDWQLSGESTRDGRIALSDDGLLLVIIRSGEVLVFSIPRSLVDIAMLEHQDKCCGKLAVPAQQANRRASDLLTFAAVGRG
jgi:hypothetical protein